MFKLVTVLAVSSVNAQFNPLRQRTMLRYVKSNVVVEKAEDEELYANPNIKQKAEEVDKLYVNPNIIEVADNDKPTNPNHKVYDAVEKDTDDKHRNPNLKAEDIDYWNSVVSESKTNMSYPIQAAAIEEKDTPCPTDDSSDAPSVSSSDAPSVSSSDAPSVSPSDAPSVSPSDAPSVSTSEVVTPLELTMSYDMSYPIQAAAIEEKDTPCPTDDSSDAPSVSSSDVPSVSPSEVLTPLEVTMSYDMSIPIQDTPCPTDEEKEDTTYANPN